MLKTTPLTLQDLLHVSASTRHYQRVKYNIWTFKKFAPVIITCICINIKFKMKVRN